MFDLGTALGEWRTGLKEAEALSSGDIAELEGHLVEQMERLRASGLSEEEAFWVGSHRLGDRDLLTGEFVKVNPLRVWRSRALWMAVGALGLLWVRCIMDLLVILAPRTLTQLGSSQAGLLTFSLCAHGLGVVGAIVPLFLLANGRLAPAVNWLYRRYRRRIALVSDLTLVFVLMAILPTSFLIYEWFYPSPGSWLEHNLLLALVHSFLLPAAWPLSLVLVIYHAARPRYTETRT